MGQLEKLAVSSTMRAIHVGVIPFDVVHPVARVHGFWVFDDRWVSVETFTAALTITQAGEVGTYLKIFARLADAAVYGRQARNLIENALAGTSPDG
ncbi:Scr1 family TA system antitoxin-like transcriptional regulator [Nonomuraea lactucae]|uniref:Scr1 family TA system antitoxin-like transcriptional regulator n=1 Tax=Nonomuraea lactucae TaxID=2249762 RepID=UPI0013B3E45A|nr:Scr1 family TA system antitoxin-like transcriptional regulator [Nonomuraea lactucae]